jgi:HlyD family secretion protein
MKNQPKLSLFTAALILALALSACGGDETATPEPDSLFENIVPMASATGRVVPAQWAALSLPSLGVVTELLVAENDVVTEGDVLLRLSGAESAELELLAAQQALDDLVQNASLAQAQALQAVANARDAVRDAERVLTNTSTAAPQIDIDQARANVTLAADRLDKAEDAYEPYRNKADSVTRAALLNALAQAQKDYDAAVRLLNNLEGGGSEIDIAQAEANLAFGQALLEVAQSDLADKQGGVDPGDLALAETRVAAAQEALDSLELRAPFDGIVSAVNVRVREAVTPGAPVIVIGNLNELQVETTDLNEIDVARISLGAHATITFDALPDVVVEGSVARIATKASAGTGVNYTVVVTLDEIPEGLLWDMTAFVDIEVD